jgi:WD40 repeat protein
MLLKQFDAPVWRVCWSATGHVLAVSSGDSTVTLWKEGLVDGTWIPMDTTTTDEDDTNNNNNNNNAPPAAPPADPPPNMMQ